MRTGKFIDSVMHGDKLGAWWGVNLNYVVHIYEEVAKEKRQFKFYGFHIGWWMIGITIAKRTK